MIDFIGIINYFSISNSIQPIGGFAFVILILFLMYNIFFYILCKSEVFDKKVNRIISIILALLLLPLKEYLYFLNSLMLIFLSPDTAALIYLFVLIVILGYIFNIAVYFKSPKTSTEPKEVNKTKKTSPKLKTKSKKKR